MKQLNSKVNVVCIFKTDQLNFLKQKQNDFPFLMILLIITVPFGAIHKAKAQSRNNKNYGSVDSFSFINQGRTAVLSLNNNIMPDYSYPKVNSGKSQANKLIQEYNISYNEIYPQPPDRVRNINPNLAAINDRIQYDHLLRNLMNDEAYISDQKFTRNVILSAVAVAAILLVLFFYFYDNKQRYLREKLIHDQELVQLELDRAKMKIANFSQSISEKAQIIETLKGKINHETDEPVINMLRHFTILTDEDWQHFQETFERVYPGFWNRLEAKLKHLTLGEKRFMALSKLGLSNKEMAAASGVCPQTLRVVSYRLRNKFNIQQTADLKEIAQNI